MTPTSVGGRSMPVPLLPACLAACARPVTLDHLRPPVKETYIGPSDYGFANRALYDDAADGQEAPSPPGALLGVRQLKTSRCGWRLLGSAVASSLCASGKAARERGSTFQVRSMSPVSCHHHDR